MSGFIHPQNEFSGHKWWFIASDVISFIPKKQVISVIFTLSLLIDARDCCITGSYAYYIHYNDLLHVTEAIHVRISELMLALVALS